MSVGRNGMAAAPTSMINVIFTGMASSAFGSYRISSSIDPVSTTATTRAETLAIGERADTMLSPGRKPM